MVVHRDESLERVREDGAEGSVEVLGVLGAPRGFRAINPPPREEPVPAPSIMAADSLALGLDHGRLALFNCGQLGEL